MNFDTKRLDQTLTYVIAGIWFINGVACKLLDLVPRHREIVGVILGEQYAGLLTKLIGFGEVMLAFCVLSKIYQRTNTIVQIALVMVMNILETILVPEMLLWGRMNMVFAVIFSGILLWKEFIFKPHIK